jgi:hypothetical protein
MSVEYPNEIKCSKCAGSIRIDYSKSVAYSPDLFSFQIEIPHSANSGADAKKNKQNIGTIAQYFIICNHCKTILGTIPGNGYLWQNSKS